MPDDLPLPVRVSAYQLLQEICFATEIIPVVAKVAHADMNNASPACSLKRFCHLACDTNRYANFCQILPIVCLPLPENLP